MSCGVRYEFSMITTPHAAKLLKPECEGQHEEAPQAESLALVRDPRRASNEQVDVAPKRPRGRGASD